MLIKVEPQKCAPKKTAIPKERPLYGMVARAAEKKKPQIVLIGCAFLAAVCYGLLIGYAYVLHKRIEERDRALEQKIDESFGELRSELGKFKVEAKWDITRIVEALEDMDERLRKLEKAEFGEEWKPPIVRCPEEGECK